MSVFMVNQSPTRYEVFKNGQQLFSTKFTQIILHPGLIVFVRDGSSESVVLSLETQLQFEGTRIKIIKKEPSVPAAAVAYEIETVHQPVGKFIFNEILIAAGHKQQELFELQGHGFSATLIGPIQQLATILTNCLETMTNVFRENYVNYQEQQQNAQNFDDLGMMSDEYHREMNGGVGHDGGSDNFQEELNHNEEMSDDGDLSLDQIKVEEEDDDEETEIAEHEELKKSKSIPGTPGRKKYSKVWDYFAYNPDTDYSRCLVTTCRRKIKGKFPTNLKKHLKSFHEENYELVRNEDTEEAQQQQELHDSKRKQQRHATVGAEDPSSFDNKLHSKETGESSNVGASTAGGGSGSSGGGGRHSHERELREGTVESKSSSTTTSSSTKRDMDSRKSKYAEQNRRQVFVGNLPQSVTEAEIRDLLTVFGPIEKVTITGRRSFGSTTPACAFVLFATLESAQTTLKCKDNIKMKTKGGLDRRINITDTIDREDRGPSRGSGGGGGNSFDYAKRRRDY